MTLQLLEGERDWLVAVVRDLPNDAPRLAYANWLESRAPDRARFLREFVRASASMEPDDFPRADGLPEEWLELVGFRLLERLSDSNVPDLKDSVLRLARPALRMKLGDAAGARTAEEAERRAEVGGTGIISRLLRLVRPAPEVVETTGGVPAAIPVGASRIGGHPDLPPNYPWPRGRDCSGMDAEETAGYDALAGFLAQVNLAEIAHTQAARDLPSAGVLSFFAFQDDDENNPDTVGAKVVYFPDPAVLVPTEPPEELAATNGFIPPQRLTFEETLDLPEYRSGPWSGEITPDPKVRYDALEYFNELNFENMLGYGRATSGDDPTPSKESRHLILLRTVYGVALHIQIDRDALAARRFDRFTLAWVDVDPGW
ncbi:MAG TPA: DUF1963 domain-containing protein [Longimicrobium sp.]|jgi:uncharacterized protein (TIGR02996 family)